jgi:hypothetical protein
MPFPRRGAFHGTLSLLGENHFKETIFALPSFSFLEFNINKKFLMGSYIFVRLHGYN